MWRAIHGKTRSQGLLLGITLSLIVLLGISCQMTLALEPPDPPIPSDITPPAPPADDYTGAVLGNENVILPVPENIVYDPMHEEPNGYLASMETDPDTGDLVERMYPNDEVIVTFTPQVTEGEIDQLLQSIGGWRKEYSPWLDFWVIGFQPVSSASELQAKIDQLSANALVTSAQKEPCAVQASYPNDPLYYAPPDDLYSGQWNLRRIGMETAWNIETGKGAYSTVGVVDTGVDKAHADLSANLRPESDQTHGGDHGTECTGIIAGISNNGIGISGIVWNAQIISKWAGTDSTPAKRAANRIGDIMRYPTLGGVVAISMSFGGHHFGGPVCDAINDAFRRGTLSVAASGNDHCRNYEWPARYTRAMAVGATEHLTKYQSGGPEVRSDFSNYGDHMSVVAPGGGMIRTTCPGGGYNYDFNGTSAATPHVAGLAALVRSEFQSMGPLDIRHRIEDTASDNVCKDYGSNPIPGWDEYTGWGFIRADNALSSEGNVSYTICGNKSYLMALPIWPKESQSLSQWQASAFPQNVFPPAAPGGQRLISQIKPNSSDYYTQNQYDANGYPLIGLIKPFTAFWVKYTNVPSITITAQGAKAGLKPGHWLEFRLRKGYNFVANPFMDTSLPLDDNHIGFRHGEGEDKRSFSGARSQLFCLPRWIGKIFYWNPDAEAYIEVSPNTGHQMPPFRGYSIYSYYDDVYMRVRR